MLYEFPVGIYQKIVLVSEWDSSSVPTRWRHSIGPSDIVLTVRDLDENEKYGVEEQVYVQKTAVEEESTYSRLQGLEERILKMEGLEGATARWSDGP